MKKLYKHILVGITVPVILLLNAFLIPDPYSAPLMYIALVPAKLTPFFENRELMRVLTEFVFGRMTPNFAPIQMLLLILFWFCFSFIASLLWTYFKGRSNNA